MATCCAQPGSLEFVQAWDGISLRTETAARPGSGGVSCWSQSCPVLCLLPAGHPWREPGCSLLAPSLQVFTATAGSQLSPCSSLAPGIQIHPTASSQIMFVPPDVLWAQALCPALSMALPGGLGRQGELNLWESECLQCAWQVFCLESDFDAIGF